MAKRKHKTKFRASAESKRWLNSLGWTTWNVEQQIPGTFFKRDLFNFGDLLAMKPGDGIMIVQTTTSPNMQARIDKINNNEHAVEWLLSGGLIQVHGWKRGKGKGPTLISKDMFLE